jgi:hypothetical protein
VAGKHPTVACVVIDEGDGAAELGRWAGDDIDLEAIADE